MDQSGRIILSGSSNGLKQFAVARLTDGGALDTSFDSDGKQTVDFSADAAKTEIGYTMLIQHDGRIVLAGLSDVDVAVDGRGCNIMRLLDVSAFELVFQPLRGMRVAYVQGLYGNVGDDLIHLSTLGLFEAFEVSYVIANPEQDWNPSAVSKAVDEIVLFGGGNMGYPGSKSIRSQFWKWQGRSTLLPQSWRAMEPAPYTRVFCRERYSSMFCRRAKLAPDLALGYDYSGPPVAPTDDIGVFLRSDHEGVFGRTGLDPVAGIDRFDVHAYLAKAAKYKTIVTDRLHFAICGLHNRRRTILLPNCYHKNRGVWEAWLKDLGCEWADSPAEALKRL